MTDIEEIERRLDNVEKVIVELQTLVKMAKPIAVMFAASLGMDLTPLLL